MVGYIFGKGQEYATPEELKKARAVANALLTQQTSPKNVGEGLSAIGQALLYRSLMAKGDASENAGKNSAAAAFNPVLAALSGPSAFLPAPGSSKVADALSGKKPDNPNLPSSMDFANAQNTNIGDDYYSNIRTAESGGSDSAKNPRSSATGRYQFTDGTWADVAKAHPDLGLTADGRLDPNQQEKAIRAFTADNASTLQDKGFDPTPGNLYAAHFLGASGATNVLGQSDASPVSAYVSQDVVKANPFLAGMSVGQFKQWSAKHGGGSQMAGNPPAVAAMNAFVGQPVQVASLDPSAGMSGTDPYSNIPAVDGAGQDQRAKFRAWNADPRGNEAANMQQIDPAMQAVIQRAKQIAGTDFVIGSGKRNADQQRLAVQNGWSGTMDSDHLTGGAADLWPVDAQGRVNFDPSQQQRIVAAMKQAAGELGVDMEAGADWRKKDMPHFGMIGQTPMNGPIPQARPDVQVASNDPSSGMGINMATPRSATPDQQFQPGQPAATSPQGQRVVQQMVNPQSMTGGAPMPMQGMPQAQPSPAPAPQPPQQVAQAQQPGPDLSNLSPMAGGTAGTFNAAQGPSMQMLYNALQQPWLSDDQRAIVENEIQRQQQAADPLRQLQLEKARRDMATPQKQWQKLDDNTLFDPASGEVKQIGGGQNTGQFRFDGKSVEAQALNGLMEAGTLTPAQAQQLGAGKTITDPSSGAIIFMTPQGVFGQPAQGGPAQPITPPRAQPQTAPQGAPTPPQAPNAGQSGSPAVAPPAVSPDGRQGMITLTPGRNTKLTEAQQRNMQLYQVVQPELGIVENNFKALSDLGNQAASHLPIGADYATTPEYQRASNSLKTIIASYLYSTSGATANPGEVENQAAILTPKPGESQASIEDKLNRIRTMVGAIKTATGTSTPVGGTDYKSKYGLD